MNPRARLRLPIPVLGSAALCALALWALAPQPNATAGPSAPTAQLDEAPEPSQTRPRIVGGRQATGGRHPWMVALADRRVRGWQDSFFCGGVLIRTAWVLTARHCVWGMNRRRIAAFTGARSLRRDLRNGIPVRAIRRSGVRDLDLALLRLRPGPGRKPLRVAGRVPQAGSVATAFGWGSLGRGSRVVGRLRRVDLAVRSLDRCRSVYFGAFDPSTMLCAGGAGLNTCLGDSGGPLVFRGRLVGITSFGVGCWRLPGVYARTDTVAGWLQGMVGREGPGLRTTGSR